MNIKKVSIVGTIISGIAALIFLGLTFFTSNFFQSVLYSIISMSCFITFLAISRVTNSNNQKVTFGLGLLANILLAYALFKANILESYGWLIILPIIAIIIISIVEPLNLLINKKIKIGLAIISLGLISTLALITFSESSSKTLMITSNVFLLVFSIITFFLNVKVGKSKV